MASDSAATYTDGGQFTIGQQQVTKVRALANNSILYSSTGAIGVSQIIAEAVEDWWAKLGKTDPNPVAVMEQLSKIPPAHLQHLFQSAGMLTRAGGANMFGQVSCKTLMAIPVRGKANLFQFAETGSPEQATEELPFVALGSGQAIADPFLAFMDRILWTDHPPTVKEARMVAAWTISHVCATHPGGVGGGPQMATLTLENKRPKIVFEKAEEHLQIIDEEEKALREHILDRFSQSQTVEPPDIPKPEESV